MKRYVVTIGNHEGFVTVGADGVVTDASRYWRKMIGLHARGVMARFNERFAIIEPTWNQDEWPKKMVAKDKDVA
ncbi:MAG: hypothetical protein ACKV2Q_36720 [Planctomycetaceae bacterium]